MTLDELLAELGRELARTWGPHAASAAAPGATSAPAAAPGAAPAPAAAPGEPAAPAAPATPEPGGERCLLMSFAGRRFAVPARSVVAVSELPPVSAVPFSPPWLRGLARAAGGVVAVVDLARLVAPAAGPPPGAPADTPAAAGDDPAVRETLLVVRASDASLDAGLAVRGIARLVTLAGTPGRPPAAGELAACPAALVAGLVPDPLGAQLAPIAVLDVDRLLRGAHEELCA